MLRPFSACERWQRQRDFLSAGRFAHLLFDILAGVADVQAHLPLGFHGIPPHQRRDDILVLAQRQLARPGLVLDL